MARGVNKVILVGHVGSDPDAKYMPNGDPVVNLSIATTKQFKDKQTGKAVELTEWHRLVSYRHRADFIREYVKKGDKLYIEGELKTRKWTDKEKITRYTTEVIVLDVEPMTQRPGDDSKPPSSDDAKQGAAPQLMPPPSGEIPFDADPT